MVKGTGASSSKGQTSGQRSLARCFGVNTSKRKTPDLDLDHVEPDVEVLSDPVNDVSAALQPLSEVQQAKFTVQYKYAQYQGVYADKSGKEYHAWACSICNDGSVFKWSSAYDAVRHARTSTLHHRKAIDVVSASAMQKSISARKKI